jgi:teichuronic acid biosynthesis glycosyltransferase TuaC
MKVLIVTAMYPTAENPAFGSFVRSQVKFLNDAGIDVDVLVLKGRFRKLIYPKGVFQLRKRLHGVSLVHAHYAYVGAVARTQWKVPVVLTYHGDDALGTFTHQGCTTRKSRIIAAGCRGLARYCDAVIVQSKQMAARFHHGDVNIIPHEVDMETFHLTDIEDARRELGLSTDKKYILFAANPDIPVKRFPLARDAMKLLREQHEDVELIVACREPQPRLALYMNACDALVFPSYQEGSPNVIKQAMACNLPIVATDVGDVREVIGNTKACIISEPDPRAFANALATLISSPIRTNGRDGVRHLAGPLVASRVVNLYERVVRTRAALYS